MRDYACLEDVVPLVAILDLAEGCKFLLEEGVEVSTATVHNFVTRYVVADVSPHSGFTLFLKGCVRGLPLIA